MLKRLSTAFLCGLAIAGQVSAQEVVVARERKPEASEQATRPPERAEPELGASTQTKSHARKDKSTSPAPTLEQMRLAGALAAPSPFAAPLAVAGISLVAGMRNYRLRFTSSCNISSLVVMMRALA